MKNIRLTFVIIGILSALLIQSAAAQSADEQLVQVTVQLAVATGALAGATIALAIISIIFGYKAHNSQKTISASQQRLVTAQEESVKEQKNLVASQRALTYLTTMLKIFDLLNDEESRRYRRRIFDVEGKKHEPAPADYEDMKAHVRAQFDEIGTLIQADLLPKDLFMASYSDTTAKVWIALKKDLLAERGKRGDKLYQEAFDRLGSEAESYWRQRHPDQTYEIY